MKCLLSLLTLIAISASAQVPSSPPYITNMTFITNEGVTTSYNFPLPPPFTNAPVIIRSPKHKEMLSSLGAPMRKAPAQAKQMLMGGNQPAAVQQFPFTLEWDYPIDQLTNVLFDVYHAYRLSESPPLTSFDQIPSGFSLLSSVNGVTVLSLTASAAQEFYIVRARDKFTGSVSNWNVK